MREKVAKSESKNEYIARSKAKPYNPPEKFVKSNNFNNPFIQRKADCACGGDCPTCEAKNINLPISHPNDASEIEADRVAGKVMRMPLSETLKPTTSLTAKLHRKNRGRDKGGAIPLKNTFSNNAAKSSIIKDVLNSSGQPMDSETRSFFEPRFGQDLSNVRVHTGGRAAQSAKAVNASAYTVGNDIVFNENQFNPQSETGRTLLAHELAHTIQQNGKINRQESPDAGVRDAGVPIPAGVPMPDPPSVGMGDVRLAEARMEEEQRQKRLFFDRLRSLPSYPNTDPVLRAEMEARFPPNTDDRWLAETILRNGPEPRWSLADITERQRRAMANAWAPEPGNIGAVLGSGSHTVQAFYFPGTSPRRALIIGGVHGSEPGAVEVVNHLLTLMRRPNAPMPFFSVIIVPELFSANVRDTSRPVHERRASSGNVRSASPRAAGGLEQAPDPNRQFPAVGSDPATNAALGCVVDSERRCIEPENLVLLDLINRFQPERVANVHGHSEPRATPARPATASRSAVPARTARENLLLEGGPSITSDPRPGHRREDHALALAMATEAQRLGVRIPGNFIGEPEQTTTYPTGTAPRMSEGVTFGQWGSHRTPTRPAMNIILIETFGNRTSASGDAAQQAARRAELMSLAQILRNFFLAP